MVITQSFPNCPYFPEWYSNPPLRWTLKEEHFNLSRALLCKHPRLLNNKQSRHKWLIRLWGWKENRELEIQAATVFKAIQPWEGEQKLIGNT